MILIGHALVQLSPFKVLKYFNVGRRATPQMPGESFPVVLGDNREWKLPGWREGNLALVERYRDDTPIPVGYDAGGERETFDGTAITTAKVLVEKTPRDLAEEDQERKEHLLQATDAPLIRGIEDLVTRLDATLQALRDARIDVSIVVDLPGALRELIVTRKTLRADLKGT